MRDERSVAGRNDRDRTKVPTTATRSSDHPGTPSACPRREARMIEKTCARCQESLSVAAFNGSGRTADGFANICRACTNARRRQRDAPRKERRQPAQNLAAMLRRGDINGVRSLVRTGAAPTWIWVCETMWGGHLALAEILLEAGVERNIFTMAAMGDLAGLTRRLGREPLDARLAVGMGLACQDATPLHVAC